MKLFIINLDRSPKRLENITAKTAAFINFVPTRIRAIDGSKVQHDTYATNGMIGCFMSHRKAWRTFLKTSDPYCIICEDDAHFVDNFDETVAEKLTLLQTVDPEWDFVYIGYNKPNLLMRAGLKLFGIHAPDSDNPIASALAPHFTKPTTETALICYAVSRKGATFLCNFVNNYNFHVDVAILKFHKHLNVYLLRTPACWQEAITTESTITTAAFPHLATDLLEAIPDKENKISFGYWLSVPIGQFWSVKICGLRILLVLLLCMIPLLPRAAKFIVVVYLLIEFIIFAFIKILE